MKKSYRMNIAAPWTTVFGLIENPEQRRLWITGLADTLYTWRPEGDSLLGAQCVVNFMEGGRLVEYIGEITGHTPPSHFGMTLSNRHFAWRLDYRLSQSGQGTQLEHSVQILPRSWPGKVVGFIFTWFAKREIAIQLASLKLHAEAMSAQGME